MIEVTLTELRKDLFRLIDRVVETGETLRVRRRGRTIDLGLVTPAGQTLQQEYDAYMALGVREDASDFDAGDPADTSHWEWSPDPGLPR